MNLPVICEPLSSDSCCQFEPSLFYYIFSHIFLPAIYFAALLLTRSSTVHVCLLWFWVPYFKNMICVCVWQIREQFGAGFAVYLGKQMWEHTHTHTHTTHYCMSNVCILSGKLKYSKNTKSVKNMISVEELCCYVAVKVMQFKKMCFPYRSDI